MSYDNINVLAILFLMVLILCGTLIWKWHKNQDIEFDLTDILMENGKVSKIACMMVGTWITTSFSFIYMTIHGDLTEWFFAGYAAAWITPTVTRIIKGN